MSKSLSENVRFYATLGFIQRIEQIVGDRRGLFREGEIEQRRLAGGAADHYLIDIFDYARRMQEKNEKKVKIFFG